MIEIGNLIALLKCLNCSASDFSAESDGDLLCNVCQSRYSKHNRAIQFAPKQSQLSDDREFQKNEMLNRGLTAKIFNLGKKFVNSEYVAIDQIKNFVQAFPNGKIVVEFGSGNRRLHKNIINVDLFAFPNVDFTMDIHKSAFIDSSVDVIIMDCVLEHVEYPDAVIREISRVLRPGGKLICTSPWLFPYHGYPRNYFNISKDGLQVLFRDYEDVRMSIHHGPTVAITNIVSEYFAVAFSGNSTFLYALFKGAFLLPIFWLKYLDWFWARSEVGLGIASTICVVANKATSDKINA